MGLKAFPEKYMIEYSPQDHVCREYQLTNYELLQYEFVTEIPIEKCPAIFGFTTDAVSRILYWSRDAIQYSKQHCQ